MPKLPFSSRFLGTSRLTKLGHFQWWSARTTLLDDTANHLDDGVRGRVLQHDLLDADLLELRDLFVRNDTATYDEDVVRPALLQCFEDSREHRHVRARQNRYADHIDVFLNGCIDDFLRRAMQSRVDDVHAGVTQRPRDDLHATVVPVQSDLRDQHTDA